MSSYLRLPSWYLTNFGWAIVTVMVSALALVAPTSVWLPPAVAADQPQYEFDSQQVPAARADEPKLPELSVSKALAHLDLGSKLWSNSRRCIACHTNGSYLQIRPALTNHFGPPAPEARNFYLEQLQALQMREEKKLKESTVPAQVIYLAAGLAEWDAHVTKKLSPETTAALKLMLDIQLESGTWGTLDCWPPFESDAYHEATVAAMAIGTAPGWLAQLTDDKQKAAVARLRTYLQTEKPLHDYSRVLLLWASTRMPDLITDSQRQEIVEMIFKHQRTDGGWSIRTFAKPEAWGGGNRAAKLREEPEFANPPSDGHQTGLAIIVLRASGVDAKDPRIQRGIEWIKVNQRESGRWWTRSLNTDKWHFITYSGTCYPLLALAQCDALPAKP